MKKNTYNIIVDIIVDDTIYKTHFLFIYLYNNQKIKKCLTARNKTTKCKVYLTLFKVNFNLIKYTILSQFKKS